MTNLCGFRQVTQPLCVSVFSCVKMVKYQLTCRVVMERKNKVTCIETFFINIKEIASFFSYLECLCAITNHVTLQKRETSVSERISHLAMSDFLQTHGL